MNLRYRINLSAFFDNEMVEMDEILLTTEEENNQLSFYARLRNDFRELLEKETIPSDVEKKLFSRIAIHLNHDEDRRPRKMTSVNFKLIPFIKIRHGRKNK